MTPKVSAKTRKLLAENNLGIKLDLGCGWAKQPGFVGMDKRAIDTADIVHDLEVFPYPLPDESCSVILMSHVWEHLDPKYSIDVMNEIWRITQPKGQLWLSLPYAWSFGYIQDPTHKNPANEATWGYFDPEHQSKLYEVYRPLPWKIERNEYQVTGNMEVIMSKRPKDYKKEAKDDR